MQVDLAPLTIEHIELVRSWRNSQFVSQFMYTDDSISQEQQAAWFEAVSKDKQSIYWVILYNQQPAGLASITNIDNRNKKCFWAFYLGSEELQGVGIGSIVEYKVLEHAFEVLKLNKICGEVLKFNERVLKLHQRFGFVIEANYRQHVLKGGEYHDAVGVGLLKEDWDAKKEQLKRLLKL